MAQNKKKIRFLRYSLVAEFWKENKKLYVLFYWSQMPRIFFEKRFIIEYTEAAINYRNTCSEKGTKHKRNPLNYGTIDLGYNKKKKKCI